ncbi:MAG: hypothetical protein LBD59_03610, partial [Prevotellaceae bacterium]|nr:hypothetical protein [Prevotellaceae bacterium]
NKIKYTPNAGAVFIDSLRYILTGCSTNPRRDSATVYIAALQSEALNYVACNGQSIRLGMKTISGVTYHWFDHETGGAALANNSATYTVSKNANLTETFWVEARYGSIVFKRYKIELHLSDNCGGTQPPLGCAADGTVIWKEDFGGNNTNDDRVSSMPLPANVTSYTHMQTDALSGDKIYALVKHNSYTNSGNWHTDFSDHTYPNDKLRGYMFMSNASDNTNDVLYQNKIKGLCGGDIYISLWATNLNIQTPVQETQRPTFRIELCDSLNVVVASYITTVIPQTATPTWYTYGFGAYIDASYDSLTLRIYTNTAGSNAGNDFVIDDIEIRLCAPPVTVAQPRANDTLVCTGSSITLTGSYSDPAVAAPESKWLYSETGNINNPAEWTEVPGSGVSGGSNTVSNNLTLSPTITDMTGYYRMVAAEASKIDKPKCRSMSRVIYLDVVKGMIPPDIRVYVKPDAGTIALSTYIDSLPYNYTVAWEPTADFQTPNSRGILDISNWNIPRTGTYKYTVTGTSGCGTYIAKAYVQSISKYDKTETIYICKDLPNSRTLNLHRLFGLRTANETSAWTYPNDGTYNIIANNISTVAGGHHAGAKLFDVLKAFNDAGNATIVASGIYEHSLNHKKFEICYTDGTVKKTIILIVY